MKLLKTTLVSVILRHFGNCFGPFDIAWKIQYTKLLKNKKIIAPFYNADQTNLPKAPITSLFESR
jgi:hypothetical protein